MPQHSHSTIFKWLNDFHYQIQQNSYAKPGDIYARSSKLQHSLYHLYHWNKWHTAHCHISMRLFLWRTLKTHWTEYITNTFLFFCFNSRRPFPNLITVQYNRKGKNTKAPLSSINPNSVKTKELQAHRLGFPSLSSCSLSRDGKLCSPKLTPTATVWMQTHYLQQPTQRYQEQAANSYIYKIKT